MTKKYFTDELIGSLEPKGKYYDVTAIGYPGLGLRVLPSGRKNWFYRYRIKDRIKLITFGQASWMKLNTAIGDYLRIKDLKDQGIPPHAKNPSATEADHVFLRLSTMYYCQLNEIEHLGDNPLVVDIANHFKVLAAAIKKLKAYRLITLIDSPQGERVIIHKNRIVDSMENGLIIE